MYPVADQVGSSALPDDAVFWLPDDDEPDDDDESDDEYDGYDSDEAESGIGFFQGSWRIQNTTVDKASEYLDLERRIATAAARLAPTTADYNRLVDAVEAGGAGDPAEDLSGLEREAVGDFGWDIPPDLGGLEVGVAGLSYALNAVGIVTAASCRGHTPPSWSKAPVVSFAADRVRAVQLQRMVARTGCTFFVDDVRPNLLVVHGRSVTHTMALADALIDHADRFG